MDVVETARNVGAKKFAQFLEKTGVAGELGRGSAVTLFAPSDEAFDVCIGFFYIVCILHYNLLYCFCNSDPHRRQTYLRIFGEIKPQKIRERRYRDLAMYHFVDKRIPTKQWGADLLIGSKLPGYKIRLNKYSNGVSLLSNI